MTSTGEISIPQPARRGKRILRFFFWTVAGVFVFLVLLVVASRVATQSMWRGIEAQRATGLSSFAFAEPQSSSLLRSIGDLQIVRAASLLLTTRDFDSARGRMEAIAQSHMGYFDELRVGIRQGSGRTLAATLRVPVEEFDSTLAQIKVLGYAEQESQTSAESGAESDTLDARLAATRVTEERLNRLVREHSGKLGEYLEVEQEIAKIRGQIEDLEAQQRKQGKRVRYGAIQLGIKEEYAARFDVERAAMPARFRNSVVEGLQGILRQGSAVFSLLLLMVPSLLFWALLLYWPARSGWRRVRPWLAARHAAPVSR